MKHAAFLFLVLLVVVVLATASVSKAQSGGLVYRVAGNGTIGYSGDGGPATNASVNQAKGICRDGLGNIYIADIGVSVIRKINAVTGEISTYAGNGLVGFAGDGGPAISAQLHFPQGLACDAAGNLYIADQSNQRVRKVDVATGIITTVAGNGIHAFAGDGGPATAASLLGPLGVFVDPDNNLYITPWTGTNSTIRKVDATTGIITTIAGIPGPAGYSGDGGPATAAGVNCPYQMAMDHAGNLYFADNGGRVRKINTSGIITTVAGDGTTTLVDGVPATASGMSYARGLAIDSFGNLYIGDHGHSRIRKVDATTGIITTVAGGGTSTAEGADALTAMANNDFMFVDDHGNIYFDAGLEWVRKVTNYFTGMLPSVSDSFSVHIDKFCSGPQFYVSAHTYSSGMTVATFYGDGNSDVTAIAPGYAGKGYAVMSHTYQLPGTFAVKQILYHGTARVDSVLFSYEYTYCRTLTAKFYYDGNSNCIKDSIDPYILQPLLVEIDSNGTSIDTVAATSGFYYKAYGNPGDVYQMKVIRHAPGLAFSCPLSGILTDTLNASIYGLPTNYFAFNCLASPGFDLSMSTGFRGAPYAARGDVIISNSYCTPQSGVFTLNMSPKYVFNNANVAPASVAGSTVTWDFTGLSSVASNPLHIHYTMLASPTFAPFLPGDTIKSVYTADPITGDIVPADNIVNRIDTVKAGLDPNSIEVSPEGHILSGTELMYTIEFENTGNDTAHDIYVLDTLSDYLRPSTINIVSASAYMNSSVIRDGGYTIVKYDFPGIMLPDSSHHNQCNGMVTFKIMTNSGLPDGTIITNKAGIYFDTNPVVMTNTVDNIIGFPTLGSAIVNTHTNFRIYPNPVNDEFTIKTEKDAYSSFVLSNSIGQVLMQGELNATQTKVSVKELPAGLYYVTLKGENGTKVQKFVKM